MAQKTNDFVDNSPPPTSGSNAAASNECGVGTVNNISVKPNVVPEQSIRGLDRPVRLDMILNKPPASTRMQRQYGWNENDRSLNINISTEDLLTLHRNPVPRSTDGIRIKTGLTEGMHVWEVHWDTSERGSHAMVGVATQDAHLHALGYRNLMGINEHSWGWDLIRNKANHGSSSITYPAWLKPDEKFSVPKTFLVVLDMDEGTLSFVVDGQYLGVAFKGLKGRELFPMISSVWGHCEISLKYIGGLGREPLLLKDLSRIIIRKQMGDHNLEERVRTLELPHCLYGYLLHDE